MKSILCCLIILALGTSFAQTEAGAVDQSADTIFDDPTD